MKVLKILKINALALLSIPLLLISIAAKLLSKALEKAMVFLGVGVAFLGLSLLNLIFNNPSGFFEGVGLVIASLIFFGLIIVLVVGAIALFGTVAAALFAAVVGALMAALNFVFELSHDGYARLYDICKSEYSRLTGEEEHKYPILACLFWSLLRGLNFAVVKLFSIMLPLSIAASAGVVIYVWWSIHNALSESFGIGVIAYLALFPVVNTVFTVLHVAIFVAAAVVVILSLGIEWGEWGQLLKASTRSYEDYRNSILQQALELNAANTDIYSFENGKNVQRCQQYLDALSDMYENVESLQQQVDTAMLMKYDSSIVYAFSEYVGLLEEISKKLSSFKSDIPCDEFERRFIPLISRAEALSKGISKNALHIINKAGKAYANANKALDFFDGCTSEEEIKRRYKALCKIYHPDVGGHEETFKILQNQYESKMAATPSI